MTTCNDSQCDKHGVQWQTSEIGEHCPACRAEVVLNALREYFEEKHAEQIKYPEYIEFYHYKGILFALGIAEPVFGKGGEE